MDIFTTLRQSERAEADMAALMKAQILFLLLRAPDGHAKNFSIQLLPRGRFQLAPLYDVMSVYPVIGKGANHWSPREVRLAMALLGKNRHYDMHAIQRRHFNSTAQKVGYGRSAEALIEEILATTPAVIDKVQAQLPEGFSARVAESIFGGLRAATKAMAAMPAT